MRYSSWEGSLGTVILSAKDYFKDLVEEAITKRKVKTFPLAQHYLVQLLEQYMDSDRLFEKADESGIRRQETLAEMLLKSMNSETSVRIELLKKLGDNSLYISGFFGDSLSRKLVDVDYYAEMGGTAYEALSEVVREDLQRQLFKEFSRQFLQFMDVLTFISQKALVQSDENLLRLYERYMKTGSDLAKEHLLEKGLIPPTSNKKTPHEQ